MTTTDRLTEALRPRHAETRALVRSAARRLAADLTADEFDLIVTALEHPTGVSTHDLCHHANVSRRQADHWTDQGWLVPQTVKAGAGYPRTYPPDQVAKATLMGRMTKLLGVDPVHAAHAADRLMSGQRARAGDLEIVRRLR